MGEKSLGRILSGKVIVVTPGKTMTFGDIERAVPEKGRYKFSIGNGHVGEALSEERLFTEPYILVFHRRKLLFLTIYRDVAGELVKHGGEITKEIPLVIEQVNESKLEGSDSEIVLDDTDFFWSTILEIAGTHKA